MADRTPEQLTELCRERAQAIGKPPEGLTCIVAMYQRRSDGSTDVAWWFDGHEYQPTHVLSTFGYGLIEAASKLTR